MCLERTFGDLVHVDRVLQVLHVLLVARDVQHRGARLRQLHGELAVLRAELDGRIEAAGVTRVVVLVASVERHVERGPVVLEHGHRHVHVRRIAVIDASVGEVSVQVLGLRVELEVLVAELPRSEAQKHGLHHSLSAHFQEFIAPLNRGFYK